MRIRMDQLRNAKPHYLKRLALFLRPNSEAIQQFTRDQLIDYLGLYLSDESGVER